MSEITRIIFLICVFLVVYVLTRKFHAWKIKRAVIYILKDLEVQGALGPESAVSLPYEKPSILRFGVRDYRPRAGEYLVAGGVVGRTENGKYYLKRKEGGESMMDITEPMIKKEEILIPDDDNLNNGQIDHPLHEKEP